jgi:hypothetical protein
MSQRKSDDTAPPTEPAEPGSPARGGRLAFPANPTAGNRFDAQNGITYIFDGVVWTSAGDSRAQERTRQEQQERERQARRVQELEREMREHKRQALELKKGLETVRALAEAAGDEKTRLAIVRTAWAEIARSGREKRAEKLETDPWRICARRAILAAIEGNPALNNTDLTDKVVEGLKTDKIRGRSRRQIERVITDMRDGGIIPPLPPR